MVDNAIDRNDDVTVRFLAHEIPKGRQTVIFLLILTIFGPCVMLCAIWYHLYNLKHENHPSRSVFHVV